MNDAEELGELPPIQQAVLDAETLGALLFDVESLCTLQYVARKSGADSYAETSGSSLAGVREALADGVAVQLRYVYKGESWFDTLLPGIDGVLLVRVPG
ncbi:MAG: hypothetical protein U0169_02215 [Polyangiaceae bacterium]